MIKLNPKGVGGRLPTMLCVGKSFLPTYLRGFETFGMVNDSTLKFDRVEPAICNSGVFGLYNVQAESQGFDCVYVDLGSFLNSTEKNDRQREGLMWGFNKVREGGVVMVQGSCDAIARLLDSICYRLERPTVATHGNMHIVAGVMKPFSLRNDGWHDPTLQSAFRSADSRMRNRIAAAALCRFMDSPHTVSLLPEQFDVERVLARRPGFFTYLLSREHIGLKLGNRPNPLSRFEAQTSISTKQIEIPKEFSVGNFAKLAADGQMDGVMNGKDGSTVLVKGFVKQVTSETCEEIDGPNGEPVSEKVKLITNQVFVFGLYLDHADEQKIGGMFTSRLA